MKHILTFNESNSYIDLIDIIEDRFILYIADEYQLREYDFDIFRKSGSFCVYKEDGNLGDHTRRWESWTPYHNGYHISRNVDGNIHIQVFFEMKSQMKSAMSDEVEGLFKSEYPDVYKNLQNFIDRVYEITKNQKMNLDWRGSRKEPQIYHESCYDFRAYNISLYFKIDKEYKYESEEEKSAKIMKWARDIYGHEAFDKLTKKNESSNTEYYRKVTASEIEDFKITHTGIQFNKEILDYIRIQFGKRSSRHVEVRQEKNASHIQSCCMLEGSLGLPPERQYYINQYNDEWFKIELYITNGLKYDISYYLCDQLEGLEKFIKDFR